MIIADHQAWDNKKKLSTVCCAAASEKKSGEKIQSINEIFLNDKTSTYTRRLIILRYFMKVTATLQNVGRTDVNSPHKHREANFI